MSWLSHVHDALAEREVDVSAMSGLDKLVENRAKTVRKLESEVAEYSKMLEPLAADAPARVALGNLVKLKEQRLKSVRVELEGFRALLVDPRQLEVPGSKRK